MDTIAITGAAGKTGLTVIRALTERGVAVRALVYREDQADTVRAAAANATVVHGDLRDLDALARLVDGAAAVYHICPNVSPDEITIGRALLEASRRACVGRFVYHSVLHPQTETMPHHWRKLRVEELILESGLPFTILQPAPYMQNVLVHWPRILNDGVLPLPYTPSARLSQVDLDDVAAAAVIVLTEPGHDGATYELCGPDVLDANAMATILTEELGRPVAVRPITIEAWRRGAREAGLDEERCATLAMMFGYYDRHGLVGNGNVLRWLLGRSPFGFRDFVRRQGA